MCDKELLLAISTTNCQPPIGRPSTGIWRRAPTAVRRSTACAARAAHLTSWAPPEPDLGFQIVRSATAGRVARALVARVARVGPCGGGGAHAGGVGRHRERRGQGRGRRDRRAHGMEPRRDWRRHRPRPTLGRASASDVQRVEARLKELEGQLAARPAAALVPAASSAGCRTPRSSASCDSGERERATPAR